MVDKTSAEDAVGTALRNQIILRKMFDYLCLTDLKQCRLVNRTWDFEGRSYLKDCRHCYLNISESSTCSSLYRLNELISEIKLDYINSLRIDFEPENHWDCQFRENDSITYDQLLANLKIKHLYISWETFDGQLGCPSKKFVIALLREKIVKLESLIFIDFPRDLGNYFDADWNPYLPNLRKLRMGLFKSDYVSFLSWEAQKEFFLKIINGAPNVKNIQAYFDPEMLTHLPEEKYSLVDNFTIFIASEEEKKICMKLVGASPSLRRLTLNSSECEKQYMETFTDFSDQLLTSSWKTLEQLEWCPDVPLDLIQRTFPVLRKLNLVTRCWGDQLLNLLKSLDYPVALPALAKLEIHCCPADPHCELAEAGLNPGGINVAPIEDLHPSTSLRKLSLLTYMNTTTFQDFSKIFPNITELYVFPRFMFPRSIHYGDLWASGWSQLERIELLEGADAWETNFDSEFLGINEAEVDRLRNLDDASLQTLHVVPVRPSLLTMQKLKHLEIDLCLEARIAPVHPERTFLSKLTGFLAFRKLAWKEVTVKLVEGSPVRRLRHLKPFARVE